MAIFDIIIIYNNYFECLMINNTIGNCVDLKF